MNFITGRMVVNLYFTNDDMCVVNSIIFQNVSCINFASQISLLNVNNHRVIRYVILELIRNTHLCSMFILVNIHINTSNIYYI